jgi:hypothetical protein
VSEACEPEDGPARHHSTRAAALPVAAALAITAGGALTASAAEPSLVNLLGCPLLENGETTISAFSELTLRLPGFAQEDRGALTTAVKAATATVSPGTTAASWSST